jgi:hypothetical protein
MHEKLQLVFRSVRSYAVSCKEASIIEDENLVPSDSCLLAIAYSLFGKGFTGAYINAQHKHS